MKYNELICNFEIKDGKGKIIIYYKPRFFRKKNYKKFEFEGEYSNNEIIGKGKEYDNFGKLIFEGEYKNGKRNGQGK